MGIGLGSVVGGYVGQKYGWEAAMLLCAAQGLIVLVCGLNAHDHTPEPTEKPELEAQETTPLVHQEKTNMWTMGCSPYFVILVLDLLICFVHILFTTNYNVLLRSDSGCVRFLPVL